VENPAIPVHIVRKPRDDNPVKSASRYMKRKRRLPRAKGAKTQREKEEDFEFECEEGGRGGRKVEG